MIKEQLINALLWNENEAIIKRLEEEAIKNDVFDEDNGKKIKRKNKESLGSYIDRYTTELMTNFSMEKYLILKELYRNYNNQGDSSLVVVESKKPKKFKIPHKKKLAVGVATVAIGATIFNIFKKKK
ncbi:hypothetical protein J2Z53_000808 [Clostridium moniliforme]|uniref:Uncharacterized protein n=1 Tax=Clostridium moniliforme TaxID=39489 RepID=A0ABS4EZ06_9CLOT|nr:hypothetical protein [Clostridium moniliforme]MBP1889227.1 hypothetical protein [Clostridium moniliforme]